MTRRSVAAGADQPEWDELSVRFYCVLVLAMPEDTAGETIMRNAEARRGKIVAETVGWVRAWRAALGPKADCANVIEKVDLPIAKYEKAAVDFTSDKINDHIFLGALTNDICMQRRIFGSLKHPDIYPQVNADILSTIQPEGVSTTTRWTSGR